MSDAPQPFDPNREKPADELPPAAAEQELDELLASASELADSLGEQVGEPAPPGSDKPSSEATDNDDALPPELEEELERLEGLVKEAADEVGAAASEKPTSPSAAGSLEAATEGPLSDDKTGATADVGPVYNDDADREAPPQPTPPDQQDVPDFMLDMLADDPPAKTGPPGEAPAQGSAQTPHAPAGASTAKLKMSSKPGVVGTGMLGMVGSPPTPESAITDVASSESARNESPVPPVELEQERRIIERARDLAAPVALSVGERVVGVLERVDRPLGMVGPRLRWIMGAVALATLGTAVIVYVVALF